MTETQQDIVSLPVTPPAKPQRTKSEKKQRISKRLAHAIELLATGECRTQKAAAERANLRADYLCEALHKPHVRVFVEQRARQTIAAGLLRATNRMVELIDAGSEHVSADMSRHIAACHGIKPANDAQVSVSVDIKAGFVIDISEPSAAASTIEVVPGERNA